MSLRSSFSWRSLASRRTVSGQDDVPVVDVLRVDGTVNPSLLRYIDRGISKAEKDGAAGLS